MNAKSRVCDTRSTRALIALVGLPQKTIAARMQTTPQDMARVLFAHRSASARFRSLFLDAIREELEETLFPFVGPPS